jgi:transcription elongation factor GreA
MEEIISVARVLDESTIDLSVVSIYSIVQIKNTKNGASFTYNIVSEEEADLKLGKISVSSPFGKGLLGKKVGDLAEITAPAGKLEFEIMSLTR